MWGVSVVALLQIGGVCGGTTDLFGSPASCGVFACPDPVCLIDFATACNRFILNPADLIASSPESAAAVFAKHHHGALRH